MPLRSFLLTLFCLVFTAVSARAEQVVISEIMYNPPAGKPEYVELWNITYTPLDIALWKFTAGIDFTFPNFNSGSPSAHLLLPQERILISSATAAATRTAYPSIPAGVRIFGPWGATKALSNSGDTITLKDKNGVQVCTVDYKDSGKWPIAADGAGHSLVLADENQTNDDWRVWRASKNTLGSPGAADPAPAAAGLALNEVHFSAATGHVDWVELRNNSISTTQLATGKFLATKKDFSDKVSLDGNVTPGAVAVFDRDLVPDNSGDLTLYLIDGSNNVLDAVALTHVAGRDSFQLFPAGGRDWYSDTTDTRSLPNNPARNTEIVINEIMADPPSGQRDGEFIELYNKGPNPVNIGGWRLDDAVEYTFPAGTMIPAGGYVVVGANAALLNTNYTGLAALGNWDGSLSGNGDRIQLKDANGNLADEVDYRFGGEWPELASGNGSSLELVNPDADNSVGSAWRDSDESTKSTFTTFTIKGGVYKRIGYGASPNTTTLDDIMLWLVGDGHVIIKDANIHLSNGTTNLFPHNNVTTLTRDTTAGWVARANHWASYHDAEGVHLLADGGGDNKVGHARQSAPGMVAGSDYTMTFDARWVYGKPRVVAQSWDLSWGGTALVPIPANLGTPGQQNSRFKAAAPPEVRNLNHSPAVPTTSSTVTVTAKVTSTSPIASVQLKHRLDNVNYTGAFTTTAMVDNGNSGDAVANDGVYSAQIPLGTFGYSAAGSLVEFYVVATAANGETTVIPRGAVVPEPFPTAEPKRGMWVVDSNTPATDLRRLRVVMSAYYLEALNTPDVTATPAGSGTPSSGGGSSLYNFKFPKHSSHYFPCTVIHNDTVVQYGCGVHKTGSPYTRSTGNSLDRGRVTLPGDKPFRGHGKIYWDNDSGVNMLSNRVNRYLLYLCGVPGNENEVIRVTRNNTAYSVRESNEAFDKDFLNRIWENGSSGYFYEVDEAHLVSADGNVRLDSKEAGWDYDIANRPGAENPVSYHNNWVPGSRETEYDFAPIIEWNKQIENSVLPPSGLTPTDEQIARMADVPAMAAYAAVRGYSSDWDSMTQGRAKNGYFYNRASDHRWVMLQWDSDNAFQANHINDAFVGTRPNVPLFYNRPLVRRYLYYYMKQLMGAYALNGPRLTAWLAAEENASPSYTISSVYATWPTTLATSGTAQTRVDVMTAFMGAPVASATFALINPPPTTTATALTLSGTAPPGVFRVECIGHPEGIFTWSGTSFDATAPWSMSNLRLKNGSNTLIFRAYDAEGTQVGSDLSPTITKTNNSPPVMSVSFSKASRNVAIGELLVVDATASYDPEAGPLALAFTVTPNTGFTITSPTTTSCSLVFNTPGAYSVTVAGTDNLNAVSSVSYGLTVFSSADFNDFGGNYIDPAYTTERVGLRDNYSPASWYSFNETTGSFVLNLTAATTLPLKNTGSLSFPIPQFPLITRALPATGNFALQTSLTMENRQYGNFLSGMFLETVQNGVTVRYAFAYESGIFWRVYKAISPTANYGILATASFTPPDTAMRIRRTTAGDIDNITFEVRPAGTLWTAIRTEALPAGSTMVRGGIFSSTGTLNSDPVVPGVGVRTAFDYLLLSDASHVASLVNSLRITEVMYHPADGAVEYIELQNTGNTPLDLNGAYFEDNHPFSAQFTFGALTLQPQQFCVVTNDTAGFISRYGNKVVIAGQALGALNNAGENIHLLDPNGNTILDFDYSNLAPWPTSPDGGGPSLEVISTNSTLYNNGTNWRASQEAGGSPGYLGLAADSDGDGIPDSVELAFGSSPYNPSNTPTIPTSFRDAQTGDVTLSWSSVIGRTYTVEYRDELTALWQEMAPVTAYATTTTYTDTTTAGTTKRFYHIKTQFP